MHGGLLWLGAGHIDPLKKKKKRKEKNEYSRCWEEKSISRLGDHPDLQQTLTTIKKILETKRKPSPGTRMDSHHGLLGLWARRKQRLVVRRACSATVFVWRLR